MKTIIKTAQVLSFFFLFTTISIDSLSAQSSKLDKWIGTWQLESDFYTGTVRITTHSSGEFLNAVVELKSKRDGKVVYKFNSVQAATSNVKTTEIKLQGVGKRASDKSNYSIKLEFYRYTSRHEAVGYYQLSAGTRPPSGMKRAIRIQK